MEKFTIGVVLGAMAGALAVANSYKVRMLVKKGQDEVKDRLDEIIDEKLKKIDESLPNSNDEKAEKKRKRA
ncbi:MAG: hypothetical protein IJV80_03210 [Clostridia bacterium]|nr:hypothetical protein [Clostridia bacterium]